jgi:hypothetical protein
MRWIMLELTTMVLLSSATARAGSFTSDFGDPNQAGFTLNGGITGLGLTYPAIEDGHLVLTYPEPSLLGSFILDDLDGGVAIESFTAQFKMAITPGSGTADGMAFCFGPGVYSWSNFGEEGPGMTEGVIIDFDTYQNSGTDLVGIDVKVAGREVSTHPMTKSDLATANLEDVFIQLRANGTLNVSWAGQVIYTNLALPGWSPVNGQFGFGARTGGENELLVIDDLSIETTPAGEPTAPTITFQPQSKTVGEHSSVTFAIDYSGTPPFRFQWIKNGVNIQEATNSFLTLNDVSAADNGARFKCQIENDLGTATSQEAILTVSADITPPTLVAATGSDDFIHATVTFSKPVTRATAEVPGNYQISGLTVTAATLNTNDSRTVTLTTSKQAASTEYTITVNNVKDTSAAGNTIAPNSTITFRSFALKIIAVGAMLGTNGVTFDVGVSFNLPVDEASASNPANYTLSSGTISAVSFYKSSPAVVLKASGLAVGNTYSITVANVSDLAGNRMPTTNAPFTVSRMQWGVVGGDELQLGNAVVPFGENGFDIYSDGLTEWNDYDEATFVYEKVTGNFDKKVRVEYQDSSSQWARAGLIVRDVTNFGVSRDEQTAAGGGKAGRYQKCHVNPQFTAMGTLGNYSWEGNRRLNTGGNCTSAGGGGTPKYPNAWCRIQRIGQTFTIFRSDDGVRWTRLGATTWPDNNKMPDTVYVGPEFSPENGNITDESLRAVWLAKFREYGDYNPVPTLAFSVAADGKVTLTFTGTLVYSATVKGPYAPVSNATSPYTVDPKGASTTFYQARQ